MTHPRDHAIRWADLRELAVHRHGVVNVEEALACGCTRSALSRAVTARELVRLAPRTLLVPALLDDRTHLAARCLSLPGAVASHRAAARLLGLDGVDEDLVEVTVNGDRRSRHGRTHRSTDLRSTDMAVVDGIPTTNATRTLCDLGKVAAPAVVERAVESALRAGMTTLPLLEARVDELARRGRQGPAVLRQVLAVRGRRAATESDFESLAVQCLRAGGAPEPERQHVVCHEGRFVARVDLAWPCSMVYGELDSRRHHEAWSDAVQDRRRQNALARAGWLPLRFTWQDIVTDGPTTAALVAATLDERRRRAA